VLDAHRVRFQLREPWPDFLLFLGTPATGAGLIVPQKYLEQVGDDGFKRHPIGAGPYKFVSHTPGVDLVLEAHEAYWRKTPQVKRLVFKGIPEPTTRLVALKKGEVDIAYALNGEMGWAVQRNPQLTLRVVSIPTTYWLEFPGKWDPKSPWHDRRVRLATSYAIAWRTTSPPGESLSTEVIPTSTSCFRNSPASSILRAEKSCCTSGNAWCMSASCSSPSTRALDSPALVHAWRNQLWA
jgi:peptide/nickel transport system substrate-binding protein